MLWSPGLEQGKENSLPRSAERRGSEQHVVLPARCGRCKCGGGSRPNNQHVYRRWVSRPNHQIEMCVIWVAASPGVRAGSCGRCVAAALWVGAISCVRAGASHYGPTVCHTDLRLWHCHAGPEPGQKQPHSARCYSNTRSPSPPPGVVPRGWRLCSRQRCRLILFRGFRRRKKKKGGGDCCFGNGSAANRPGRLLAHEGP